MSTPTTQPIDTTTLTSDGRKLWNAARQIRTLEYEITELKKQRRELATFIQSMLDSDEHRGKTW